MSQALIYTVFPVIAMILGIAVASWRQPSAAVISAIQHLAAGIVFAAAAGEVLPNLKHASSIWPIVIGGGAGILVMLGLSTFEAKEGEGGRSLLILVSVDVLIDGLVLGIGFAAGDKAGLLLTIALTIEVLFLGLTLTPALRAWTIGKRAIATFAIALLFPVGVLLAVPIAGLPLPYMTGFFAFGLIALLYLVTEELLVEAHEVPDTPWQTAMFFVGFLGLLLLEQSVG